MVRPCLWINPKIRAIGVLVSPPCFLIHHVTLRLFVFLAAPREH